MQHPDSPILASSPSSEGLNPPRLRGAVPLHPWGGVIGSRLLLSRAAWLESVRTASPLLEPWKDGEEPEMLTSTRACRHHSKSQCRKLSAPSHPISPGKTGKRRRIFQQRRENSCRRQRKSCARERLERAGSKRGEMGDKGWSWARWKIAEELDLFAVSLHLL